MMKKVRAFDIKIGDTVETPSFPKTYSFVVKEIKHTTRNNTIIKEPNGREWKVRSEQWINVI